MDNCQTSAVVTKELATGRYKVSLSLSTFAESSASVVLSLVCVPTPSQTPSPSITPTHTATSSETPSVTPTSSNTPSPSTTPEFIVCGTSKSLVVNQDDPNELFFDIPVSTTVTFSTCTSNADTFLHIFDRTSNALIALCDDVTSPNSNCDVGLMANCELSAVLTKELQPGRFKVRLDRSTDLSAFATLTIALNFICVPTPSHTPSVTTSTSQTASQSPSSSISRSESASESKTAQPTPSETASNSASTTFTPSSTSDPTRTSSPTLSISLSKSSSASDSISQSCQPSSDIVTTETGNKSNRGSMIGVGVGVASAAVAVATLLAYRGRRKSKKKTGIDIPVLRNALFFPERSEPAIGYMHSNDTFAETPTTKANPMILEHGNSTTEAAAIVAHPAPPKLKTLTSESDLGDLDDAVSNSSSPRMPDTVLEDHVEYSTSNSNFGETSSSHDRTEDEQSTASPRSRAVSVPLRFKQGQMIGGKVIPPPPPTPHGLGRPPSTSFA
eukprot:c19088_g1_i3.p1 GENE.c19088_g1_i3~~c19088_g1_i3.p1  ORF type:complete len:570 (-),score=94.84 c19088_g1_i3:40-1542(-)